MFDVECLIFPGSGNLMSSRPAFCSRRLSRGFDLILSSRIFLLSADTITPLDFHSSMRPGSSSILSTYPNVCINWHPLQFNGKSFQQTFLPIQTSDSNHTKLTNKKFITGLPEASSFVSHDEKISKEDSAKASRYSRSLIGRTVCVQN